jgi:hypothetical protein
VNFATLLLLGRLSKNYPGSSVSIKADPIALVRDGRIPPGILEYFEKH